MFKKNLPPHIPYDKSLNTKARQLRNQPTPAEQKFWNALKTTALYKETTFNRQKPLGPYIVDFYCHEYQWVIEIDGDTHGQEDTRLYDDKRTGFLESHDLQVIRFTNREVSRNIDGVMVYLEKLLEKK